MAKLTPQQWEELLRKKQSGSSYNQLAKEYNVSKQAIIDKIKANRANDVVEVAAIVLADQEQSNQTEQPTKPMSAEAQNDLMDANNIDEKSRSELNVHLSNKLGLVKRAIGLQEAGIRNCEALLEFMWNVVQEKKISAADFAKYAKLHDNLVNQIERLCRLQGMGFSPSTQINQQFNMGNGKTNGKKFDDDEFTGNEKVEIIFCTSKEQAEILKRQENE